MALLCPKCHNVMNQYERNGIHVDQCVECGGLFLDRGELDHLVQAEAIFYGGSSVPPRPPDQPRYDQPRYDDRRDPRYDDRRDPRYDDPKHAKKKKRRGFLEDLLDL